MLQRTFILDFVKQEFSTTGVVSRQGEKGEEIRFKPYAGGQLLNITPSNATAKLKGITNDNKYIELPCIIEKPSGGDSIIFVRTTQDWNSAAGAFKTCYVELKMNVDDIQTSTVNLDWYVLPEASVTGNDQAHYVDQLQEVIDKLEIKAQEYLDQLHDKMHDIELGIDDLNGKLDDATLNINNSIQSLKNQVAIINQQIIDALKKFESGNFYTKPEADARFMLKGEIPDNIQKFKLTSDDGTYLPLPSGVTSFTALGKYTGYYYVTRDQAMAMSDQGLLPALFQNKGLYVSMPVGAVTNFYRYQEIAINISSGEAKKAFRNTNGTSSTEWVVIANDRAVALNTSKIALMNLDIKAIDTKVENLELRDKIIVYKEKSLPNYGTGWDGVNASECRFDFKRVGNRVTLNARMNVTDVSKFLHGSTGTMDQIYKVPVGFRQEVDAPFFNTAISTNQWAFATNEARNYQGVVEQSGYIRWTTKHTGNHYLTATYFTEDPYPTEGVLGTGQVRYFTPEANGSIEFGGDW